MSGLNWTAPVFGSDVTTSSAYLQRLQEFLSMQQPGNASNSGNASTSTSHKRKEPSEDASGSAQGNNTSLKDRRQSVDGPHSHNDADTEGANDTSMTKSGKQSKTSTSDKRKEQNRNAQRAFRERKEKVVKDLEDKVMELTKASDDREAENQNLKDMVTRLQQENARLQQSGKAAPQTDFTFNFRGPDVPTMSVPREKSSSRSSSPPDASAAPSSLPNAPASFSDSDILAFLSQPAQPSDQAVLPQHQFEMIPASMPNNLGDDFFWNSSAFGTEIPQVAPAKVTNLLEQYGIAGFNSNPTASAQESLFGNGKDSLSPASFPSFSSGSTPTAGVSPATSANATISAPAATASNTFTGATNQRSTSGYSARSSSGDSPTAQMYNAVFERMLQQQQQTNNNASLTNTNNGMSTLAKQALTRNVATNSSAPIAADSPETTCSSNGSDPSSISSDHQQPITPNNGQTLFGANMFGSGFGGSSGLSPFSSGYGSLGDANAAFSGVFGAGLVGSGKSAVTTPSGIFDTLNYRDPLFAGSMDNYPLETVNFNDFLVASPPALGSGANDAYSQPFAAAASETHPVHPQQGSREASGSSSSGYVPTLGGLSDGTSPSAHSSTASSPKTAFQQGADQWMDAAFGKNRPNNVLPHDVTYDHPLIQHVFRDTQGFSNNDHELETLCSDMKMKASCKDVAMQRIANSIASDETTLRLYQQYLADNQDSKPAAT